VTGQDLNLVREPHAGTGHVRDRPNMSPALPRGNGLLRKNDQDLDSGEVLVRADAPGRLESVQAGHADKAD